MARKEMPELRKAVSKGFTLIELLVVVSIIALLVSILLPSLNKARQQAQKVKCMVHVRGVGMALFMYAQDNDERYPYSGSGEWDWGGERASYWCCTVGSGGVTVFRDYITMDPDIVFCPSNKTWRQFYIDDWSLETSNGNTSYIPYCGRDKYYVNSPMKTSDPGSWCVWGDVTSSNLVDDANGPIYNNHGVDKGANWGYVDGHVEYVEREDLVDRWSTAWVTYMAPETR